MSILLEALKKAEARKREQDAAGGAQAPTLSLAPLEAERTTEAAPPAPAEVATPPLPASGSLGVLELAPVDPPAEPAQAPAPTEAEGSAPNTPPTAAKADGPLAKHAFALEPAGDVAAASELSLAPEEPPQATPLPPPKVDTATPGPAAASAPASATDRPTVADAASLPRQAEPAGAHSVTASPPTIHAPAADAKSATAAPSTESAPGRQAPATGSPVTPGVAALTGAPATAVASPSSAAAAAGSPASGPRPVAPAPSEEAKRRRAKTVLAAPRGPRGSGRGRTLLYAGGAVTVLALLGGGMLWLRELGVPPFGQPASLIAVPPPAPGGAPELPTDAAGPASPAAATESATGMGDAALSAPEDPAAPGSEAPAVEATDAASPASEATPDPAPPVAPAPASTVSKSGPSPAASVAPSAGTEAPASPRSALETPIDEVQVRAQGELSVQRRLAPSGLQQAYADLQAGRHEEAERGYRQALAADPRNADALLGLAVVADARGDREHAQDFYRRVLVQQPNNAQAIAGLIGPAELASAEDEQRLRELLILQPESATLHAALGQRLAAQRRWGDAQAAFFEAHVREPENADHLYNLAVALDQLQQTTVAAEHYRKALALPDASARFDREAARMRLSTLDAAGARR